MTKEKMIETIMNDPMINIIGKQGILRRVLEKHLQDTTEKKCLQCGCIITPQNFCNYCWENGLD